MDGRSNRSFGTISCEWATTKRPWRSFLVGQNLLDLFPNGRHQELFIAQSFAVYCGAVTLVACLPLRNEQTLSCCYLENKTKKKKSSGSSPLWMNGMDRVSSHHPNIQEPSLSKCFLQALLSGIPHLVKASSKVTRQTRKISRHPTWRNR